MPDTLRVRGAEPADAPRLAVLWGVTPPGPLAKEFEETLRGVLRSDIHAVFLIESPQDIVACIHGAILPVLGDTRVLHIFSLIVATAHRRAGLGRRLIAVAEAWAGAQGCTACTASDGHSFAGTAGFWRAVGYEHAATTQEYRKSLA
jgi:GNAT superfamily N-acetyltransferase